MDAINYVVYTVKSYFKKFGLIKKRARVALMGLDNSGKTTLSYMLCDRYNINDYRRRYRPIEEQKLEICNTIFEMIDIGGHRNARRVWREYYTNIDCIIYIVDASDPERFGESKEELDLILEDDDIKNIPILLLGNKIDKPGAVPQSELIRTFGLVEDTEFGSQLKRSIRGHPIKLYMCSITRKKGYQIGLRWLGSQIGE